ncbi:hypothetical protein LX36DRAFT_656255 [Colletotrichum falcatum]|nr:hypothetical protein LX36DRAFT_656255 [Colletotrichum falcatum]
MALADWFFTLAPCLFVCLSLCLSVCLLTRTWLIRTLAKGGLGWLGVVSWSGA